MKRGTKEANYSFHKLGGDGISRLSAASSLPRSLPALDSNSRSNQHVGTDKTAARPVPGAASQFPPMRGRLMRL